MIGLFFDLTLTLKYSQSRGSAELLASFRFVAKYFEFSLKVHKFFTCAFRQKRFGRFLAGLDSL